MGLRAKILVVDETTSQIDHTVCYLSWGELPGFGWKAAWKTLKKSVELATSV
jgi:hypothetical protein